jgi:Secretin and TonB N terminus short domain
MRLIEIRRPMRSGKTAGGSGKRRWLSSTVSVLALLLAAAPAQLVSAQQSPSPTAADRRIAFNIGPQDLNGAILAFADRAGVQVFYDASRVQSMHSSGVSGTLTAPEALTRLLAGTGVTYRFTSASAVSLEQAVQTQDPASGGAVLPAVRVEGMMQSGYGPYSRSRRRPAARPAPGLKICPPACRSFRGGF